MEGERGILDAIRHAAEAGKLRSYVRKNGGEGLAGLLRLADRHSAASAAALGLAAGAQTSIAGRRCALDVGLVGSAGLGEG